jgi:hypothetical protein
MSGISLPTKNNVPSNDFFDYSSLFFGDKGVGKSEFVANFPDVAAHFMCEPRGNLPIKQIPKTGEPALDRERLWAYANLLCETTPDKNSKRIVIDSLDPFAKMFEAYWAKLAGAKDLSKINDHGKTWAKVKADLANWFSQLHFAGYKFTVLSHVNRREKITKQYSRDEVLVMKKEGFEFPMETRPSASPWALEYLKQTCNFFIFYGWDGLERIMIVRGTADMSTACGSSDHFLQPNGKGIDRGGDPLASFHVPSTNAKDVLKTFISAWNNKVEGYFNDEDYDTDEQEIDELDIEL